MYNSMISIYLREPVPGTFFCHRYDVAKLQQICSLAVIGSYEILHMFFDPLDLSSFEIGLNLHVNIM